MVVRRVVTGFRQQSVNLRKVFLLLIAAFLVTSGLVAPASANSRYAAYVLDARTGQVLFARNENAKRYPASLTKMMSLYLLFEAMESGRVNKNSRIPISAKAAAEPPTKIGLKAGSTIRVEDAILSMITRSANDISTAVGEFLGGSEANFARMMTAKAKQLGMNNTQFRNAHGLPNPQQFTTARDMAILGVALREHFPRQYPYFSTRSFTLGKKRIGNHNRLLGRVEGADGIKTGYTRASGFNLVSSVQSNGRSVVAVVMGGQSARSRDDHMAALLREHMPKAARRGGSDFIAAHRPVPGAPAAAGTAVAAAAVSLPKRDIPMPSFRPDGEVDIQVTAYLQSQAEPAAAAAAAALPAKVAPPAAIPTTTVAEERFAVDPVTTAAIPSSGWAVQIGSSPSRNEALSALVKTGKQASRILGDANAFIEEFDHKGTRYYRARFAFSSKSNAQSACNALKKQRIDCFAAQL